MNIKNIRQILVASDLSDRALYAVRRGALLAAQHKAQLSLLHVLDTKIPHQYLPELNQKGNKSVVDTLSKEAEKTLREQATTLSAKNHFNYNIHVEQGTELVKIIKQASKDKSDLLVLGAHGKHFFQDVFLGTTAEKVVHESDRPVLVVRNPPEGTYKRVLIPIDFSEMSRHTLALALSLTPNAEFIVLHAYHYPTEETENEAAISVSMEDNMAHLAQQAKIDLDQFLAECDLDTQHIEHIVKFGGYPPAVIRMIATQCQPDLVLVGAHSHKNLRDLLLGNTAMHALRELSCDVLVVRLPPLL